MKKQITSISAVQTAKTIAVLYLFFSIPFVILMGISFSFAPSGQAPGIGFLILMPILYVVLGFIFTLFFAWAYNLTAKWVGGIEYNSSEI